MGLTWLMGLLLIATVAASAWLLWLILRDVSPGPGTEKALLWIEVGLVVNLVAGVIRPFVQDAEGVSMPTWIGYLVTTAVLIPLGYIWSVKERNRGGTGVLLVAVVTIPVLLVRLGQIWTLRG